ncbi:hypothetical protein ACFW04_014685 [Cataglyphis niger]
MLERIIADRFVRHLREIRPYLNESQYSFREGKQPAEGGMTLAVSLDIANAFNTLPWVRIHGALEDFGGPEYLRRIIRDSAIECCCTRIQMVRHRPGPSMGGFRRDPY